MGSPSSLRGQDGPGDSRPGSALSQRSSGSAPPRPRVPRQRTGHGSRSARAGQPDLAAVARNAVVRYLHEATERAAESEAALADGAAADQPGSSAVTSALTLEAAQDVAVRAAVVSVANLDRIEAAAAKLEADIVIARREQASLQARAGAAAAAAVRAAQEATEASSQARRALRLIGRYVLITLGLVLIQLVILLLFAGAGH
jgi:hypothetical protein